MAKSQGKASHQKKYQAKKKRLAKKCNDLWQQIIKILHPYCEICGRPTKVGHHFIYQSEANSCKFYIPNGIGLCKKHHFLIHHTGKKCEIAGQIALKRGQEWFDDLQKQKRVIVKTILGWYEENLKSLEEELNKLKI